MIPHSLRWRLQLWYGLVLVVVLAGFGFTAYQLERGRLFRRVDDELQRRANVVANFMRPRPLRGQAALDRNQEEPPPERARRGFPPFDRDPDDMPRGRLPSADEFYARLEQSGLFDEGVTNGFYFIVLGRDGNELFRSENAPAEPAFLSVKRQQKLQSLSVQMNRLPERFPPVGPPPNRFPPETHGKIRETVHVRPAGEFIFVGRSIGSEIRELRATALKLSGVGAAILLLGLAGGWWVASRAIRPIRDISSTAAKISAGDLSQRINVKETESEFGQLAGVLNSTFSRLEAAFAQQRQFAADAAHELRTPVTVLLTETQTALNRERSAEDYRSTVEVCQRVSQRMRRLIESLLELARLDAGQEQMKRMPFDLAAVARDCIELVRPLAVERGVEMRFDLPSLEFTGDSERVARVITNLLTNAVTYNKPGGFVHVALQREERSARITVTDTGIGISPEDLPRVFARFYRADKSRSSANTGLGLAISKAIVEAHGGTIEISSTPGEGSKVIVRLPN